jgi:hypothetical protein
VNQRPRGAGRCFVSFARVRRLVVGTGSASDASAFIVAFYRRDINYHGVGGAGIVLSTEAWPRLK